MFARKRHSLFKIEYRQSGAFGRTAAAFIQERQHSQTAIARAVEPVYEVLVLEDRQRALLTGAVEPIVFGAVLRTAQRLVGLLQQEKSLRVPSARIVRMKPARHHAIYASDGLHICITA